MLKIRGAAVVLHPFEIVSVVAGPLGPKAGSLSADGQVLAALDELLSRAGK